MIVRILGNYHHADPYGGITGDCAREVPMGIAVGVAKVGLAVVYCPVVGAPLGALYRSLVTSAER